MSVLTFLFLCLMIRRPSVYTLFPYTTLFRSRWRRPTFGLLGLFVLWLVASSGRFLVVDKPQKADVILVLAGETEDRKSTRLNSSHLGISYAVFCLKKKHILINNVNIMNITNH